MPYEQFFSGVVKWERRRSQMGSGLPIETILKTTYNVGKKVLGSNFGKKVLVIPQQCLKNKKK